MEIAALCLVLGWAQSDGTARFGGDPTTMR